MHLVLLAYHFPPSNEVGALRAANVAKAFLKAGHRVSVIRAPGSTSGTDSSEPEEGPPAVITITPGVGPRELYARLKKLARHPGQAWGAEPAYQKFGWVPPDRANPLKRLILSLMYLPDGNQGFILPAARVAANLVRTSGEKTLLYSSGPPHSTHLAALLAARRTGAPLVVEFRDPWIGNPGKPWYTRTALTDAVDRRLERACLRRAALVVTVSEGMATMFRSRGPHSRRERCLVIRNGIEHLAAPRHGRAAPGPFRIAHLGTLYAGRDPTPFLESLARVVRRHGLGPDDVSVELIGNCEWFDGKPVRGIAARLGLESMVKFSPWLPHDEAMRRMEEADLLLLLALGQPNQVPNKFYEYLGTRRPLLLYADPDGETAGMARRLGGHFVVQAGGTTAEQALEAAILGGPQLANPGADDGLLEEWRTDRQMARLVKVVEALPGLGPAPEPPRD